MLQVLEMTFTACGSPRINKNCENYFFWPRRWCPPIAIPSGNINKDSSTASQRDIMTPTKVFVSGWDIGRNFSKVQCTDSSFLGVLLKFCDLSWELGGDIEFK